MPIIVLSYRRDDARGVAGRIFDRLVATYGKENVFIDVDTIPAGVDFRAHLHNVLNNCDVMLAVIGPRWRGSRAKYGRLAEAGDFVRIEIETALRRDVRIIPVLIDNTPMPSPEELPREIAELASRRAVSVDSGGTSFHSDMDRLIRAIDQRLVLTHQTTNVVVSQIRRRFLSAPPKHELTRAKYELDAYLAKNPGDVDARILQDQIAHAIAYELGAEGLRPHVVTARAPTRRWAVAAAAVFGAILVIAGIAASYFFEDRNRGEPSGLQGFTLQKGAGIEGTELNPGTPAITATDVAQCAQACRLDADCAAFSFRKAADIDGRHTCALYRAPVRQLKDDGWISGLRH
jgi:uncharacterized RmlC-like cupin family protein